MHAPLTGAVLALAMVASPDPATVPCGSPGWPSYVFPGDRCAAMPVNVQVRVMWPSPAPFALRTAAGDDVPGRWESTPVAWVWRFVPKTSLQARREYEVVALEQRATAEGPPVVVPLPVARFTAGDTEDATPPDTRARTVVCGETDDPAWAPRVARAVRFLAPSPDFEHVGCRLYLALPGEDYDRLRPLPCSSVLQDTDEGLAVVSVEPQPCHGNGPGYAPTPHGHETGTLRLDFRDVDAAGNEATTDQEVLVPLQLADLALCTEWCDFMTDPDCWAALFDEVRPTSPPCPVTMERPTGGCAHTPGTGLPPAWPGLALLLLLGTLRRAQPPARAAASTRSAAASSCRPSRSY